MDVLLIFVSLFLFFFFSASSNSATYQAGLFSAVNTAFIIAMQPNPVDTTNALLVQLLQTLDGSSTVQPTTLSAPTGYSSAYVWAQALAYASLAFSLLAAFGAVLGKQWIGYYQTNCYGSGSLEARCEQRHRKFQKLQNWQFENVLHLFPMLIEISLLLFSLSLGAAMWTQHQAISILIIATAALGALGLIFTMAISAISLDFPFQAHTSLAIRATFRYIRATFRYIRDHGGFRSSIPSAILAVIGYFREGGFQSSIASAIQTITHYLCDSRDSQRQCVASAVLWILQTSTNPDAIDSAVELMLTMPQKLDVNIESVCGDVRDMFKACFDHHGQPMRQRGALAYGKLLINLSWKDRQARTMLENLSKEGYFSEESSIWTSWRSLYLPSELDQCLVWYGQTNDAALRERAKADLRTALRMAVTIGIDGFTHPDDDRLIWDDQFRLHSFRSGEDISRFVDQLINYVKYFHTVSDFEAAGDALLLASGIATIPDSDVDSAEALKVIDAIASLRSTIGPRWSCIILGVVRRFHKWRAYTSAHSDKIPSQAVLTALCPPPLPVNGTDTYLTDDRDDPYESWLRHAMRLLRFHEWPEDHHLKHSPLFEIHDLVLRALHRLPTPKVDNAAKFVLYSSTLGCLMDANNPKVRSFALRAAFDIKQELVLMATDVFNPSQEDMVFSKLSSSLLTIAKGSSTEYPEYLPLISSLAKNRKWRSQLMQDGHDCGKVLPI